MMVGHLKGDAAAVRDTLELGHVMLFTRSETLEKLSPSLLCLLQQPTGNVRECESMYLAYSASPSAVRT